MKESLKQDLKSLKIEGNTVFLPSAPLQDYAGLKKALTKATGKYKRNTFVFPSPAQPIINALLGGSVVDFKKEFQFFATPRSLAETVADLIVWSKPKIEILEPSAGHGVFIDTVLSRAGFVEKQIDAVELSELNLSVLREKYPQKNVQIISGNFLEFNPGKKYDLIIANPPFSKNQDIDHVRKMYSLLAPGGQLLSIASKSWTFGSQKKQKEFKNWLENDVAANWIDLESGSFKSSGTNVAGVLIDICK